MDFSKWTRTRAHRFFLQHGFYPLLLGSLLGATFLALRALYAGHWAFRFLLWNLFLALVPYVLSLLAVQGGESLRRKPVLNTVVWTAWFLTFPNAPYILTDLVHIKAPHGVLIPWYYDLGMLSTFALAGGFAGVVSLKVMHDLVRARSGELMGWSFVTAMAFLSGFGIYLGRFGRWNSWDALTQPHLLALDVLERILNPLAHPRTMAVTFMFGAMLLVMYLMYRSGSHAEPEPVRAE